MIEESIAKKEAVKDTYFKIGLIGDNLELPVKTEEKGIDQVLGYDQADALLLKKCSLKSTSPS